MSAQHIHDTAPLGALIRFSNGEARPPARFTRKVERWENHNATGRLITKTPARERSGGSYPASLTLHLGDYGTEATVLLVVTRTFLVTSSLDFSVVDLPRAGAAESWLAAHHWSNARIETVSEAEAACATPMSLCATTSPMRGKRTLA